MQIAVSALGPDRPGIVAAVSGVLSAHGCNIADSQMGILSGRFSMVLVVDAPDELSPDVLLAALERGASELGLDTIQAVAIEPGSEEAAEPTHIVTVYGVDHTGIVHAVSRKLADMGVDITDLNTRRVVDEGAEPLYAMMLEIAPPAGISTEDLQEALAGVAVHQDVEVTVRELEDEPL